MKALWDYLFPLDPGPQLPPPKKPFCFWKWCVKWFGIGVGLVFVSCFAYAVFVLPPVTDAEELQFAQSTVIYDAGALKEGEDPNDHVLYVIHGDENREYIPLNEIPQWVKEATIAIEDDRFYSHFGFDVGGITKAVLNRFFGIGTRRGGSTITQQLVKNSFLSREKTIARKFNEILLAIKVEWHYEKDQILEMYLNKIPYGHNAHGIEAAAKTFFGKSARELTLAETVVLVSLPVAPSRFSPYGSKKHLLMGYYEEDDQGEQVFRKGRKDLVLQRMLDLEMISFEDFKTAFAQAKELEFRTYRTDIRAPHFVFYVREILEQKYGKEFLRQGGLKIYTTLDPDIQEIAEETIRVKTEHHPATYEVENAALVAINPDNGAIVALVGGKDYFDSENDGQVNIMTSRRQPGSSFKPFVYAAAFEKGYSPSTVLFDVETDFGGNYQPQNFDGKFLGPVSARTSLNHSLNIPAIKMAYLATPEDVLKLAEKAGIKYEGNADIHGVALGVGVAEVEPLSHISGYQVFARDGSYYAPSAILEIRDSQDAVLETFDFERNKQEGISPASAALVRHILTDETSRPETEEFAWNKLLQLPEWDNGSKTGTSNRVIENPDFDEEEEEDEDENPKTITVPGDSWTIGFTSHLVAGVWIGNNRGKPMKEGATGLAVAAPVWKRFMIDAHNFLVEQGADKEKLYPEFEFETLEVNQFSGKLATEGTPEHLIKEEVFDPEMVIEKEDDSVVEKEVERVMGRRGTVSFPYYARKKRKVLELSSVRPEMPNWVAPVEEWLETHPLFVMTLGKEMDPELEEPEDEEEKEAQKEKLRELRNRLISEFGGSTFAPLSYLREDRAPRRGGNVALPLVKIESPKDGTVAPGEVEVQVSVNHKKPISAVEFYWDEVLMDEVRRAPWVGRFRLPEGSGIGTTHGLRVIAVDREMQAGESSMEVTVEGDYTGPDIVFLGPLGNQRVPLHSTVHFLVDVQDGSSRVKQVKFWVDGAMVGVSETPPYQTTFMAEGKLGRHYLMVQAWDEFDNMSERSVPIVFEREKLIRGTNPEITTIANLRNSIAVDMVFPQPDRVERAELIVEKNGEDVFSKRFSVQGKSAQMYVPRDNRGKAWLWLKVHMEDGGTVETGKREVDL